MPLPRLPTLVRRDADLPQTAPVATTEPVEIAAASNGNPAAATLAAANPSASVPQPAANDNGKKRPAADPDVVRAELSLASDRTGLDEVQLARIREAKRLVDDGDSANALHRLELLNSELDGSFGSYTVSRGEGLWQIASKPEIFGNPYLWPLIWRANMATLPEPSRVLRGQRLRIPKYPHLVDVADAIAYSHSHALGTGK